MLIENYYFIHFSHMGRGRSIYYFDVTLLWASSTLLNQQYLYSRKNTLRYKIGLNLYNRNWYIWRNLVWDGVWDGIGNGNYGSISSIRIPMESEMYSGLSWGLGWNQLFKSSEGKNFRIKISLPLNYFT